MRNVEQTGAFPHSLMLGSDSGGILDGHLIAGEWDDFPSESDVDVVEGRPFER